MAGRFLDAEAPMRLLVIGDFSGRGELSISDVASLEKRPILRIDLDTFDQVLAKLKPSLRVEVPGVPGVPARRSPRSRSPHSTIPPRPLAAAPRAVSIAAGPARARAGSVPVR